LKLKPYSKDFTKIIGYLFFGVLTTAINFLIYSLGIRLGLHYLTSNGAAFIVSVAFAYITNRRWVFKTNETEGFNLSEASRFLGSRLLTLLLESILLYIFITVMMLNRFGVKVLTAIIVVVSNYLLSERFVFSGGRIGVKGLPIKSLVKPSVFAVVLLLIISGYALFFEPLIGLADNGDFSRVMIPNDLNHEQGRSIDDYFGYFNNTYDRLQYYNEYRGQAKSSHSIVIRASMLLDDVFTRDAVVIMDADLQDPPELITEMIFYWEQGYDDIYAKRRKV